MNKENARSCSICGYNLSPNTVVCPACGVQIGDALGNQALATETGFSEKDWLVTLLLCLFVGYLGIHRFYVGKIFTGILQIITFGGCGIWVLIDIIMIVTSNFKDEQGKIIKSK